MGMVVNEIIHIFNDLMTWKNHSIEYDNISLNYTFLWYGN